MKNLLLVVIMLLPLTIKASDLNEEFQSNFSSMDLSAEAPKLNKYKIIILRGIFNNYFSNLSNGLAQLGLPIQKNKYAPFTREIDFLNSLGIESTIPSIETENTPEKNGIDLVEVIKASKKPVIIISHSKGGIDALYGLTAHPEIWPKVAGWINLQCPVYGTELADLFLENPLTELPLRGVLLGLMGGKWPAIQTLTVKNMSAFHKKNGEMVKKLVQNVPILSVASIFNVKSPLEELLQPIEEKSPFAILNRALFNISGKPNDGFTAVSRACLAGTPCLVLNQVDHGTLVVDLEPFYTFDKSTRIKIYFSLLEMLESRIR